jgi:hypothetical protein
LTAISFIISGVPDRNTLKISGQGGERNIWQIQ